MGEHATARLGLALKELNLRMGIRISLRKGISGARPLSKTRCECYDSLTLTEILLGTAIVVFANFIVLRCDFWLFVFRIYSIFLDLKPLLGLSE